ncbi:hypothetical protein [Xanthobacter versatilis]|uniref:hypothetical protein n=1 Tax=Xanthobacter autotrophicus (strain ATCC BAA-1158 / Py2) TaxID=78245 RepID=UPI0037262CFC
MEVAGFVAVGAAGVVAGAAVAGFEAGTVWVGGVAVVWARAADAAGTVAARATQKNAMRKDIARPPEVLRRDAQSVRREVGISFTLKM